MIRSGKTQIIMLCGALLLAARPPVDACTGISLASADGAAIVGRTVEWALSDAGHYRIAVFPRTQAYRALTPEGAHGMAWTGSYGFVSMTAYEQPYGPDGLNEAGLYVGMYYLPGFASYATYDPAEAERSVSVGDLMQWLLSTCATVEEARQKLQQVRVVHVEDERFGGAPLPFHWKISDPSGAAIVVEIVEGGVVKIYDAFLGVITNAPTYDWHLTNLRNYIGLSPAPDAPLRIADRELTALGAGSGMLGLPGDFTPPSRFVRAAAFVASVRPLATAEDAVFEAFRILDSFNIPLGAVVPRTQMPTDIEGATQITSVCDLTNRVYYYHSMFNREVRMIDLKQIDFARVQPYIFEDESAVRHAVRALTVPPERFTPPADTTLP
jgi:choloylglycine hydrolase